MNLTIANQNPEKASETNENHIKTAKKSTEERRSRPVTKRTNTQKSSKPSLTAKIESILNPQQTTQWQALPKLPSFAEKNEKCGEISAIHKCKTCKTTYPLLHICHRLECPECYRAAAARIGARGSRNIRAAHAAAVEALNPDNATDVYGRVLPNARLDAEYDDQAAQLLSKIRYGGIRHIVLSPPPNLYDAWKDYDSSKMTREVSKHTQKYFPRIIGSAYVYHPYRIQKDIISQLKQYRYENPGRIIQIVKREKEDITVNHQQTLSLAKNNPGEPATYGASGFWADVYDDVLGLGGIPNYINFSPHIHLLYMGTTPPANEYYEDSEGWIYKHINGGRPLEWDITQEEGKPLKDAIAQKLTYLASHAALFPSESGKMHDVIHYTGLFAPRASVTEKDTDGKITIRKKYYTNVDCEKCGTGNHLVLCSKDTEEPIIGRNGEILAHSKIIIPRKRLTQNGINKLQRYLTLNWAVSRIQSEVYGKTPAFTPPKIPQNTPDPPPQKT